MQCEAAVAPPCQAFAAPALLKCHDAGICELNSVEQEEKESSVRKNETG